MNEVASTRLGLGVWDRGFWVVFSQGWAGWKEALAIVQRATVIRWHRAGFRLFWNRRSRKQRPGRPRLDREIVSLIHRMSQANVTWGAPRIRSELAMLGIEAAVSTEYMLRRRRPPSSTWRAFPDNHLKGLGRAGLLRRAKATFGVLFGLLMVTHHRRRVLHFNVTANPTAEWTARQVIHAFPEETAPRFLVRDRDKIYGERYRRAIAVLGIEDVITAARSPWQNPYAERLIGSLRRECLDHVIVLDEVHLRRILGRHLKYYNATRCHLSLACDAPEPRAIQGSELGRVVEFPEVGGLHHRHERAAA